VTSTPTWYDLQKYHCSYKRTGAREGPSVINPCYEYTADRRYNYAPSSDQGACRIIFLRGVLEDSSNRTLVRHGRFIWCRNFRYEGLDNGGLRQVSFTVDAGKKRFLISENNMLCLPSTVYINNNRYFRQKDKTFSAFSSVFAYPKALRIMTNNHNGTREELEQMVLRDNPYKSGTLVSPRLGYFYPTGAPSVGGQPAPYNIHHPYGIILGSSLENSSYGGREFYRVRFGDTTYERVHPIEMEIINEV